MARAAHAAAARAVRAAPAAAPAVGRPGASSVPSPALRAAGPLTPCSLAPLLAPSCLTHRPRRLAKENLSGEAHHHEAVDWVDGRSKRSLAQVVAAIKQVGALC